ncbi:MAG: hypothetical protein WDA09_07535 [Bacteriovoracaceae bacterium]
MSNPFFIFATLCLSISLNVIGKSAKPGIVELRWILPADAWGGAKASD